MGTYDTVVVEAGRSYFDTNTGDHHHFFHEDTNQLEDIPGDRVSVQIDGRNPFDVKTPTGKTITDVGVIVRLSPASD